MNIPKVAVLLPTFNSEKFILVQLASILSQENVDVDVFVYDDGSTDNTVALINMMFAKSKIFFIENDCSFGKPSLSFLHLLHTASLEKYDYVSLADHDDIWSCYKISTAIEEIKDTRSDAFSSSVLSIDISEKGYKNPYLVQKSNRQRKFDYVFEGPGPGCTFVLTKKFVASFRSFLNSVPESLDDVRWHDWFLYYFARMNNFSWTISSRPNMLYFQWGSNDTGVNRGVSAFNKRLSWVFSGWYFEQSKFMYNTVLKYSGCAVDDVNFMSYRFWIFNALSFRRSAIWSIFFCAAAIVNVFKMKR